jgi:hypothetical protein
MGMVRRFAVARLEEAARRSGRRSGLVIGALDETGQEKAGTATTGVQWSKLVSSPDFCAGARGWRHLVDTSRACG